MRFELVNHDVGVTAVCPNAMNTGIMDTRSTSGDFPCKFYMASLPNARTSLETIAGKVIKAIEKNRPYVVPNAFGRINRFQKGIAPTLFDAAWSFLLKSGIAKPLFPRLARLGIF